MNVTKNNILFCRQKISEYEAKAAEFERKAETTSASNLRGSYLYHARQRMADVARWRKNLAEQMAWLAENDHDLWIELRRDNAI